ncbi:hypothetical protein NECAME_09470 [Necator americanus]|uniref:Uncharacterized protein n=1 Tax=Necator americanus TaxID=51031 RepID=W2TFJ1_NECAM|nr:hypothetical protein NECAME_09470 [Necator americanus]ETN79966.1 hypothetical protein NECAME_09470 [Necator americanus]
MRETVTAGKVAQILEDDLTESQIKYVSIAVRVDIKAHSKAIGKFLAVAQNAKPCGNTCTYQSGVRMFRPISVGKEPTIWKILQT